MPVFINVNYTGWFAEFARRDGGKGLSREGKRVLLTAANREVVDIWHRTIIRKHFQPAARRRYHFQQRKRRYRGIKKDLAGGMQVYVNGKELEPEQIIKGGEVDIVRSGTTERKANIQTAIFASPTRAKTRVIVPDYVLKKRPGQPNQKREIQKITRSENNRLTMAWRGRFLRGAKRFGHLFKLKRRLGKRSGSI